MRAISREWDFWRIAKIFAVALPTAVLIFFLYFWRLGTLAPGLSTSEVAARTQSTSIGSILNNPVNAPHKLLQYFFQQTGHHGAFWMRSVSVFFALIFIIALYLFLRKWFGNIIGFLGALLFASTPWVIIISRNATPDIMYFSPVLIFCASAYLFGMRTSKDQIFKWFAFIIAAALALYAPGVIWFVLFSLIIWHREILKITSRLPAIILVSSLVIFILILSPLLLSFYSHPSIIRHLLLIPNKFYDIHTLAHSLIWSSGALFIKAHSHIDYIVGRLAILNFAQTILAFFGFYSIAKRRIPKALTILSLAVIGIVFATLNLNIVLLSLVVLAFAILDAAAIRSLYTKWCKVFPINPIPRIFAALLVGLFVLAHVAYGVRYSLYAWPHSPATNKVYVLK
jgi:4-amino-4-deoxy-L-arabinose transferase-like glycosyltransferase